MNIEDIREYCLQKRGVTEDCAFGPNLILFRLCHKIFACIDLLCPDLVVLKMSEDEAIEMRERYKGICGAWHWNKKHWSEVSLNVDVEEEIVKHLLDKAYELIRLSLPKKTLYNFPELPEGWRHEHFPILDSAMNVLHQPEVKAIDSPYLMITADYQTAGRGQGKNTWESEDKKNLLFAFRCYPTEVRAVDQFHLLQAISVAVAQSLEKYIHEGVSIKWPNDIYCGNRKICGILIEHDICGQYVSETRCGIGINVNQKQFFGSAPNPVSICQLLGKEVDRAAVLRNFVKHFMNLYSRLLENRWGGLDLEYMKRLYRLEGWFPYRDKDGDFEAQLYAINEEGCLMLEDREGKIRTYAHKEVEFVLTK